MSAIRGECYGIEEWGMSKFDSDLAREGAPVNKCMLPDFERYPKAMSPYTSSTTPAVNSVSFPNPSKIEEMLVAVETLPGEAEAYVPYNGAG